MVLITSYPNDKSADRILFFLAKSSIPCIKPACVEELDLLLTSKNGITKSQISYKGVPITAIINRGIPVSEDEAETFYRNEWTASWWSAIAMFQGPVINRANRHGMMPQMEAMTLSREIEDLAPCPVVYSNSNCEIDTSCRVSTNLHSIYDHRFLGRWPKAAINNDQPYAFTSFQEEGSLLFLAAGEKLFSLSRPKEKFSPLLSRVTGRLHTILKQKQALFSLVVLDEAEDKNAYRIVYTSTIPHYSYFRHFEEEVYTSLIKFLSL